MERFCGDADEPQCFMTQFFSSAQKRLLTVELVIVNDPPVMRFVVKQ
jgi:hypothetical protein